MTNSRKIGWAVNVPCTDKGAMDIEIWLELQKERVRYEDINEDGKINVKMDVGQMKWYG
jgi:hypothetical protein